MDDDDDGPSRRREEASGPGWQEHFVDARRAAAAASVGLAVSQSLSYVTISHFASVEERRALLDSATAAGMKDGSTSTSGEGGSGSSHVMFASDTNTNCDRYSVQTLLDGGAKTASGALLHRLLGFLDGSGGGGHPGDDPAFLPDGGGDRMAVLAREVFGTAAAALRDREATWYAEPDESGRLHPEPKVNLYSEGGYFAQHGDGMALTLLVVLTDAFEGGGTAFYRDLELAHDDIDGATDMSNASHSLPPESIARPLAGTAMIWGGTLQHMALPVTKGSRAVYVGSFDLD